MNKFLNVAIIGLGVGEQHLLAYKKNKYVNKIFIFDKQKKKMEYIKKKYPQVLVCSDEEEIFQNKIINIVSIASYDQFHCKQVCDSLRQNKHVFCEKPLCLNETELQKIKKYYLRTKLSISTNTILRMSPRFKEIKSKIDKNYFGDIYYIEVDYNYGRVQKIIKGWRGKIDNFSVVLSGGIHMVDLVLWYLKSKPKIIKSFSNNICTKKNKLNLHDQVVSLIKFESNVIVKLSCNFGCVYPHFHRIMVYGNKGSLEQSFNNEFTMLKKKSSFSSSSIKSDYPGVSKGGMIDNFIDNIIYGKKLILDTNEMFEALDVCFKINKSLNNKN